MARLVWTEKAIGDLAEIGEYIEFDDPEAARRLVSRVGKHLDKLVKHPLSGPVCSEFPEGQYRQISENPCRAIYRYDGKNVIILRILRSERLLRPGYLDDME
jgi:plasmid stabilization system protein ParE